MARVHCFKPTFHWVLLALLMDNGCRTSASIAIPEDIRINCDEAVNVKGEVNAIARTTLFPQLRTALTGGSSDGDAHEKVAMIGKDVNGELRSSSIISLGRKNHSVIDINFPGAIADLHNHPGNTAPSSGDLYNLIRLNTTMPAFILRFVCLEDGNSYALAVYDQEAASVFIKTYPPQANPGYSPRLPDALFNEFAEMKSYLIHINGVRPVAADEMATAFILDKYKTGVALFKANAGGEFQRLIVREKRNKGDRKIYNTFFCP